MTGATFSACPATDLGSHLLIMKNYRWFLRRALAAGAAAGITTSLVVLFMGEPTIRKALKVEDARATGEHATEMFSRSTQVVGGAAAAILYGLVVGVLFCGAFLIVRHRLRLADDFRRVVVVAGAGFIGTALIPALKYPANPPAVGDPDTIAQRTVGYFALLVWGLIVVTLVWIIHQRLSNRAVSIATRSIVCSAYGIGLVAASYLLLPDSVPIPSDMPAGLIWRFRLISLAGLATTWLTLGLVMGWLCDQPDNVRAMSARLRRKS